MHDKVGGSGRITELECSDLDGDFIVVVLVCLTFIPTKLHLSPMP